MTEHQEPHWAQGLKKTRQRKLVLAVLREAEEPMTALQITTVLERRETPVWLSTVYRVLDSFVEHGMLRKTAGMEGGMSVYEVEDHQHRDYAVCTACHRIIPLESCPLEEVRPRLRDQDFQVTGHRLQMYGFCAGCAPGDRDDTKKRDE